MGSSETAADSTAAAPARFRVPLHGGCGGRVVAVVGAGFSGTMAAIHLRRALPPDCSVVLFDRSGRFARGPAYAASDTPHMLNVRSGNMSALPGDPGHFERWLAAGAAPAAGEVQATEAGTFATRRLYGRYLRALLFDEMRQSGGRVRLCADEAVGLAATAGGYRLRCASGRDVAVAAVVVATGNLPSDRRNGAVVVHDPWAAGATAGLRPDEPVLVVGTGLTMVDLVLGMVARGFAGPFVALSRRGLVPQRHGVPGAVPPWPPFTAAERASLTALLRLVRRRVRAETAAGRDWRPVIDALRPETCALWQGLPCAERGRFLRHLRPYWDVHRHRLAPGPADAFAGLVERGAVRLRRGRVRAVEVRGAVARVEIQGRGAAAADTLTVQRVIYATGIGGAAGPGCGGFLAGLVAGGMARTDRHGMGLEVTDGLRLVDAGGGAHGAAWALGPVVRGMFWECTAVPDIRTQAETVAAEVARLLAASPPADGPP